MSEDDARGLLPPRLHQYVIYETSLILSLTQLQEFLSRGWTEDALISRIQEKEREATRFFYGEDHPNA